MSKSITYASFRESFDGTDISESKIKNMWEDTKKKLVEKYKKGERMSPEAKNLAIASMGKTTTSLRPRRSPRRSPRRNSEKTVKIHKTRSPNRRRSPSPIRNNIQPEKKVRVVMKKDMADRFMRKLAFDSPSDFFDILNASPSLSSMFNSVFWAKMYIGMFGRTQEFFDINPDTPASVWKNLVYGRYVQMRSS